MNTVAEILTSRAADDGPALLFEGRTWSYRELVEEGRRRAATFGRHHRPGRPPHIGVLLDNRPEYLFWLTGAALAGATVVGINATYRGAELAQLITHTDCEILVTSGDFDDLLDGVRGDLGVEAILDVDDAGYQEEIAAIEPQRDTAIASGVDESTQFLLIFTSGSTGRPKAVRCTQGRFARTGAHVTNIAALTGEDVVYTSLPFFHSSSLFTGWSSAIVAGAPVATRRKFSASQTLPDLRATGATLLTYTGKVLNYILAVPERPDDADSSLRLAIGNEASVRDIREFARRFGCTVRDSYGSTEGIVIIRRDPSMPEGALGTADDTVRVLDPETGEECPRVQRGPDGSFVNLEAATGEIVETNPNRPFEGYYKNEAATGERFRDGCYWSGDLAYRDADGWFYFAGRSNEWLRVDGENFAAAPVEAIVLRHPGVRSCAVYAVPDDPVGDRVMVAVELADPSAFDPTGFDAFLRDQPDLGPKWVPHFVWVTDELPKLASMKVDKTRLRRDAWRHDNLYWRPSRDDGLRPMTDDDRNPLEGLLPAR